MTRSLLLSCFRMFSQHCPSQFIGSLVLWVAHSWFPPSGNTSDALIPRLLPSSGKATSLRAIPQLLWQLQMFLAGSLSWSFFSTLPPYNLWLWSFVCQKCSFLLSKCLVQHYDEDSLHLVRRLHLPFSSCFTYVLIFSMCPCTISYRVE